MYPLQAPGGPELLVIVLIGVILIGIVFALFVLVRRAARQPRRGDRIEDLEARVEALEADRESNHNEET